MDVHKPPLDKYGRYPYQNWTLGRDMTTEEEDWIGSRTSSSHHRKRCAGRSERTLKEGSGLLSEAARGHPWSMEGVMCI
jgi:hypothetical protein